jgi:ABC-type molybdate transport system substrate-binding protein
LLRSIVLSADISAEEITVAAAADLQSVMHDVITQFQKKISKSAKVIYGSSGKNRGDFVRGEV